MEQPSIKKNFMYSMTFQLLTMITPFITAPYVSRVLGADGLGIQSYTAAVQVYFSLFAALGTSSYGARTISQQRNDKEQYTKSFWEIVLMKIGTSLICLFAWLLLIYMSREYRIYYIILTCNMFATMFDITWFFDGLEQFKLTVIRNILFKVLGIVCIFVFVRQKDDLAFYIGISAVSGLLSSLSLWPYLKHFLIKIPIHKLRIIPHFRESLIYFIPTIATSVYTYLDKTLIGLITHDSAENGYYEQAEKIINMAKSIVFSSLNAVMGVRIAYLFAQKRIEEIHQRIENSMNYIFLMGFGCMFGIMGIAKNFVPLFFGEGYGPVVNLLYILAPIIVIIGISNCLGSQYYSPVGKRAQSAKYLIVGSGVNLVLNLFLIPQFGSLGAACASICAELVITVLYVKHSDGYMNIKLLFSSGGKKMIAGLGMFVALLLLGKIQGGIFCLGFQIYMGVVVYLILLIVIKDKWSINFMQNYLKLLLQKMRKNRD